MKSILFLRSALTFLLCMAICSAQSLSAQETFYDCRQAYSQRDRLYVSMAMSEIESTILRMHELARVSAAWQFSFGQRRALATEYKMLMEEITAKGESKEFSNQFLPKRKIKGATEVWFDNVFDASFLGLNRSTLDGSTNEEAQQNASEALRYTPGAISKMWRCFGGGW